MVQERSFTEMSVFEGFVPDRHRMRTIIVGIDARLVVFTNPTIYWISSSCSIWLSQAQFTFQAGHAQAGENPELRTMFFKLASLLQSPVMPLFVFDGPKRPSVKRGFNVVMKPNWLTKPFQELLDAFGYFYYTASRFLWKNDRAAELNMARSGSWRG